MLSGFLGEVTIALAFSGALVATLAFFAAHYQPSRSQSWFSIARAAFIAHLAGGFSVMAVMFYLIFTHQYQYHFVWDHSSNELPIHFIISCFWEGQEGSFLLWTLWQALIGVVLLSRPSPFRNTVMGTLSSVQLILSSMVLGVHTSEQQTHIIGFVVLILPPAIMWVMHSMNPVYTTGKWFAVSGTALGMSASALALSGNSGAIGLVSLADIFTPSFWPFLIFKAGFIVYLAFVLREIWAAAREGKATMAMPYLLLSAILAGITAGFAWYTATEWKVGSTPFMSLKDAFPDNPIWAAQPDFVPSNGDGLNPLLQNYWMVIHPPMLFLGFATTVVPFLFVVSALLTGMYKQWIRPAMPWMIVSAMLLGIGIILGGYWAYETLSFGGYWNWDPVENSSLVPWLLSVASIHSVLAYRHSKGFLRLSMVLAALTFLMVLYSTFLTRSGILGDTSVHSFTDLGLSGQLILLVGVYSMLLVILFTLHWSRIPEKAITSGFWSREVFLLSGSLILIFSAIGITLSTSLPVFNAILGTSMAPPKEVQFFYFKWNIWFGILLGVFSGIGQFLFWNKVERSSLSAALVRPFLIAIAVACIMVVYGALFTENRFIYEVKFAEWVSDSPEDIGRSLSWVQYYIYLLTDELLLASSLFTIAANFDILIGIIRRKGSALKAMGGSLAHIGLGLMLIGILYSSGFERVISRNLFPENLSGTSFTEQEKVDNVMIEKGQVIPIQGYQVRYLGRKDAIAPVRDLEVIEENANAVKVAFSDSTGDRFAVVLPADVFRKDKSGTIDLELAREYLDENVRFIRPRHINQRMLYGIQFMLSTDSTRSFTVYPEAEINEGMGLLAHPSRKVFWDKDIYVHISTIPKEDEQEQKNDFDYFDFNVKLNDTVRYSRGTVIFESLSTIPPQDGFQLIAKARLKVITYDGREYYAEPLYMIDDKNFPTFQESLVGELETWFAFVGVDPDSGTIGLQIQSTKDTQDFIVFKAIEKPLINLLWLGTFFVSFGFAIAAYRRFRESGGLNTRGEDT